MDILCSMENVKLILAERYEETYSLFLRVRKRMEEEGNYTWSHGYPNREIFENDVRDGCLYLYKNEETLLGSVGVALDFVSYFFSCSSDKAKATEFLLEHGLSEDRPYFLLERFMVDPSKQGHGIGSDFLKRMLKMNASKDCLVVAYKENKKAIRFYQNHGFVLLGDCKKAEWGIDGSSCLLFAHHYEEH